jgi:hypothetical protein
VVAGLNRAMVAQPTRITPADPTARGVIRDHRIDAPMNFTGCVHNGR